jgi:hypothetical protein
VAALLAELTELETLSGAVLPRSEARSGPDPLPTPRLLTPRPLEGLDILSDRGGPEPADILDAR